MRWRPFLWFCLSLLLFATGAYVWHLADQSQARSAAARTLPPPVPTQPSTPLANLAQPIRLLSAAGSLNTPPNPAGTNHEPTTGKSDPGNSRLTNRLSNTSRSLNELIYSDHAIVLENALVDTEQPANFSIPPHLRAASDPGTYIVQARRPLDDAFRSLLRDVGATIVTYIPNNAYLIRASQAAATQLAAQPQTQSVLPWEPFYKLKDALLELAINQKPLPDDSALNLLLFPDARGSTLPELEKLGAQVLAEAPSPFGPLVRVRPTSRSLAALAGLPGVHEIEFARPRVRANDLSRAQIGVASNSIAPDNYLGLTGSNILVNINDGGVDANHPDLVKRVFGNVPGTLVDTDGHGTHVAGIIAGSGAESLTVTNALGSIMPGTNGQFRGKAPAALLFAMDITGSFGSFNSDPYLQETAARTNAFISNNSWEYFSDNSYDLGAASYDAAVRDALPSVTGSHPLLYVFAAGNNGGGHDDGGGGSPDSISSPGTAKNVITVGASEQKRGITNETWRCEPDGPGTNSEMVCITNTPWVGSTDTSNQVAAFSGRGNVGVLTEGDFGRFKPDVIAPGTFVVSTRSSQWDEKAYYNPTNYHFTFLSGQTVGTNGLLNDFVLFVPDNAVQLIVRVFAADDLAIYVKQSAPPTPTSYTAVGTNFISLPPAAALTPVNDDWHIAIGNTTHHQVTFSIETELVTTNDLGNYFEVLSNLNNSIGAPHYYRYESGTSMAAGEVSGTLALMQEFFQRVQWTNSPALMKALLINGARSLADRYDLAPNNSVNFQGWGLIHLPNSIPGVLTNLNSSPSSSSIFLFDQSPTNALATGQSRTYNITITTNAAKVLPLRATLVWTDPPGNPVASTKLVNDLDLIVTNKETGQVFIGNNILFNNDFNLPWNTNSPLTRDVVNNVENVFLSSADGTNFSITVSAHRVNVNAVTAQTNDVFQDYALVISSGDGEIPNALQLSNPQTFSAVNVPAVTFLGNDFAGIDGITGGMLLNERVGGSTPLLGTNTIPVDLGVGPRGTNILGQITIGITNQWRFYVLTNTQGYTNAEFLTFLPPTLSIPRMGVEVNDPTNSTRAEADVDLYVSRDPNLTNLSPTVLSAATKSISRSGTESIILSNAVSGAYFVAVKSEAQEGAQYGFLGSFTLLPPSQDDQNGRRLRGINVPRPIPDGTPAHPGHSEVLAVGGGHLMVKRVIVTNILTHELISDLLGYFSHGAGFAVLNNHSGLGGVTNYPFAYDDSLQPVTTLPRVQHTDGPGTLRNFGGREGAGQWLLQTIDNGPGHIGTNVDLRIYLEKQKDLTNGVDETISPGACTEDFIEVPADATNMVISVSYLSGTGPLTLEVCPIDATGSDCATTTLNSPGASLTLDKKNVPLLNAGLYVVRICNPPGGQTITVHILATLGIDINGVIPVNFKSAGAVPILDDAVSFSGISVDQDTKIVSLEVGVRIEHPRESDLVLHLIGPDGTRVLLDENRGALSSAGMGRTLTETNIIPVHSQGGNQAVTNIIDTGHTVGAIQIVWDFYPIPDWMHVYYQGNLIFDSGAVSGPGSTNLSYGPGSSTLVTIVMNEGGNTNGPTTKWTYTVTSAVATYTYTTFTEDTRKTLTPIKFATPPFTNNNYIGTSTNADITNGIYYLPEDSLGLTQFTGKKAKGNWQIEVWDNRAGATNPQPNLLGWQLSFVFQTEIPKPGFLTNAVPVTNTIPPNQMQCFTVDVPNWASFATNALFAITPTLPLNLWYNATQPPSGTNSPGDVLLFTTPNGPPAAGTNVLVFTNGSPLLVRNSQYYLCVQNTNNTAVTYALQVDFDITPLTNGIPVTGVMASPSVPRYFSYDVTSNETAVSFLLTNLNGNVNLVARYGSYPDFPSPTDTDYGSFNPGTNNEAINIFTNSDPVQLTPGRWYLGVFNVDTNPVNYTIVVVDYTNPVPNIITLFNMIPYANTNAGVALNTNDYYRFVVTSNAVRAQFEIDRPSADMTLVARQNLPLPTLPANFDFISANPGTSDEVITIFKNSRPIPLTPGEWFLTAVNVSGGQARYTIMASEFPVTGTNIVITNVHAFSNSFFCITWTSLPGLRYYIQGKTDLTSTTWVTVSPTIIATNYSTTYCIPLPSPLHFFRVVGGISPGPGALPVGITSVSRSPSGVLLRWLGLTNAQYRVQWTPSIAPAIWNTFSETVTSTTGLFQYLDNGSQTGGLGPRRFYRLLQLP